MKNRIFALALTAVMALSVTPLVSAADLPFTDVPQNQWYYNDVVKAYETGLINGKTPTTFEPDQNMTYAEAVKLAACMNQRYTAGSVTLENGSPWYQTYVDYCKENGVLSKDYNWNDKATRAGYAEIFAKALPASALPARNNVVDDAIPDVTSSAPQADAIYTLYRAGIVQGSTIDGVNNSFNPNGNIKRSEVAAILTRMMDENARLSLSMPNKYVKPAKPVDTTPAKPASLSLKYDGGGQDNKYYVQEATIGAPVCADLDKNGSLELIYTGRSVFCLNAANGKTLWRCGAGTDVSSKSMDSQYRAMAAPQVADVDGDGRNEVVTCHTRFSDGTSVIAVYDENGHFKSGWPRTLDKPAYAMNVTNFEGDGWCEIVVALGVGASKADSLYVFEPDGSVRPGWPVNSDYGFYDDTLGYFDITGNGVKDVVGLFDGEQTRAWDCWGKPIAATGAGYEGLLWNSVPVGENLDHEMLLAGLAKGGATVYANSSTVLGATRNENYCIIGTHGGVVPADVDGDGKTELVYTCGVVDASKLMSMPGGPTYEGVMMYDTLFILNTDRTRFVSAAKGFDWTQFPMDNGPVIDPDAKTIKHTDMKPAVADMDGDGNKEILYSANDGKVHCWSLDKTEKNHWPFTVCSPSSNPLELASRPVVADVNNDGKPEVVFGTYVANNPSGIRGSLYILDYQGNVLAKAAIPVRFASATDSPEWPNGVQATPCVADLDGDGKMEVALTTLASGLVVYDVN